jgi:hypothetical protein
MAKEAKNAGKANTQKAGEPVFIIRPVRKNWGLDYLHISLIVLALILIALAFSLSNFKAGPEQLNTTNSIGCGSQLNATCSTAKHTQAEALSAAESIIASYADMNSTLSLLPYYSLVNRSTVSYMPSASEWLVVVPYIDPFTNETFNLAITLNDSNLTLVNSFNQLIKPIAFTNNSVVAPGTVMLYGKSLCSYTKPFPVYLMVDPYAPGAMSSIRLAMNVSNAYRGTANFSYIFIFTGNAAQLYRTYGTAETQEIGRYTLCASEQKGFPAYIANLSNTFFGSPLSNYTLSGVAGSSRLNMTQFNSCLYNSTSTLQNQATLARLYGVSTTPEFIVNCRYSSIPQTLTEALAYANRTIKSSAG